MLFEGLNWIKRNVIMTAIILMSFGVVLLIMPQRLLPALIQGAGAVLLIISVELIFEFMGSNKTIIHYILLTGAIAIGIGGLTVLVFQEEMVYVMGGLFGALLIFEGVHAVADCFIYARRSEKNGWWIIIPMAIAVIVLGVLICINPWWKDVWELKMVIGGVIIVSAIFTILRLIWLWPIRSESES